MFEEISQDGLAATFVIREPFRTGVLTPPVQAGLVDQARQLLDISGWHPQLPQEGGQCARRLLDEILIGQAKVGVPAAVKEGQLPDVVEKLVWMRDGGFV